MGIRLRLLAFVMVMLSGAACSRQPTDAPCKDRLAGRPVVVLTPDAVRQVFRYRDRHGVTGRWRLRVEVQELPNGRGRHRVDLDLDPTAAEDLEYDFEGIRVVVARSQVEKLRGTTLGYHVYPDKEGFTVRNPNLPDTRE
jgi:Fe-S cluster assembly iron-binding protein IscA